jgi:nucleoside-diphosphate kinase
MTERTLSIIKPDATDRNLIGKINVKFEESGLKIIAQKRLLLTAKQAADFYAVHAEKPFFQSLINFMTSGPVVVQVLSGEDAINKNRDIMGATNPSEAADGTIRKEFALDIERNSVHGSDSKENAEKEISYFFAQLEIS